MTQVTRRIPIVATIVVLAAVATMIALGVWQLQRKEWKEDLLARYEGAAMSSAEVAWPTSEPAIENALYHRSRFDCAQVTGHQERSGQSAGGEPGWAHLVTCRNASGQTAEIALGWSDRPAVAQWSGGAVTGMIGPATGGAKLVADPPQAGLQPLARPDPRDIPNNHFAYAIQWFLFAVTALVIYALALRKRWRG